MKNADKITLVGIKQDLANGYRGFKNGCYVCHENHGMTFHHLWYLPNEKIYSDFKNSLDYYRYLAPIIQADPKRFLFVCNAHHQAITRLCRWKGVKRKRLIKAVMMTK